MMMKTKIKKWLKMMKTMRMEVAVMITMTMRTRRKKDGESEANQSDSESGSDKDVELDENGFAVHRKDINLDDMEEMCTQDILSSSVAPSPVSKPVTKANQSTQPPPPPPPQLLKKKKPNAAPKPGTLHHFFQQQQQQQQKSVAPTPVEPSSSTVATAPSGATDTPVNAEQTMDPNLMGLLSGTFSNIAEPTQLQKKPKFLDRMKSRNQKDAPSFSSSSSAMGRGEETEATENIDDAVFGLLSGVFPTEPPRPMTNDDVMMLKWAMGLTRMGRRKERMMMGTTLTKKKTKQEKVTRKVATKTRTQVHPLQEFNHPPRKVLSTTE
ncbi:hypothetical protein BDR26DRAFT_590549 [Obelidium mucronatum]|nr:hypothetical protein BDR26DRAFT_590549 [Obelidium mucronatum]